MEKIRKCLIYKILILNKKLFWTVFVGMIICNIYVQYCIFGILKEVDISIWKSFEFNYIYMLITAIFTLNYGFILREIIVEHFYDFYVLKVCGKSNKDIGKIIFTAIILLWMMSFGISAIIFLSLLLIMLQSITNYILTVAISFAVNMLLNMLICGTVIYKNVIQIENPTNF